MPTVVNMQLVYSRIKLLPAFSPRVELKISTALLLGNDESEFMEQSGKTAVYHIVKKDPATGTFAAASIHVGNAEALPDEHVAYVVPASNELREGDEIGVCLMFSSGGTTVAYESRDTVKVNVAPGYTLSFEPSYVASQQLINSQKRGVGHLDTNFEVPALPHGPSWAAWYWKGTSTLSTDGKDKSTAVDASTGLRRNLLSSGYMPGFIEARGYGNQTALNASAMVQGGIEKFFPRWRSVAGWKRWLANDVVNAPASPGFTLAVQNEWRIEQDKVAHQKFPGDRSIRLFSQVDWAPIRLLPSPKDLYTVDPGSLSIERLAKGWLLPHEQRLEGTFRKRVEGDLEISLLVAASKFSFKQHRNSVSLDADNAPKQRIRMKYMYGANEANGFTHVHQLSLGIESAK